MITLAHDWVATVYTVIALYRTAVAPHFAVTNFRHYLPRTLESFGFFFLAALEAFRELFARIAPALFFETPSFFAIFAWILLKLKIGPFRAVPVLRKY